MNYVQHKSQNISKIYKGASEPVVTSGLITNLTGLSITDATSLVAGQEFRCKLVPDDGYYLPAKISVVGTNSLYGFAYDHTSGDIFISGNETTDTLIITAKASDANWDIPAQFEVAKITSDTYNGSETLTGETFLMVTVTPSRGSTVTVTYGDVTRTISGTLTTENYDSPEVEIIFGTYHGVADEVATPDSGVLTISGAYETYDLVPSFAISDKNESSARVLQKIINVGAPRYLRTHTLWAPYDGDEVDIVFNTPLGMLADETDGIFGCNGTVTFNKKPYLYTPDADPDSISVDVLDFSIFATAATGTPGNGEIKEVYYNNIDLGKWLEGSRVAYMTSVDGTFVNGEDIYNRKNLIIPESCTTITSGIFDEFQNVETIELPSSLADIVFSFSKELEEMITDAALDVILSDPTILLEEAKKDVESYIEEAFPMFVSADAETSGLPEMSSFYPMMSKIILNPNNNYFYVKDDCIITKDEEKRLKFGKSASIIPCDVKVIDKGAFYNSLSLVINLPATLTRIEEFAFMDCYGVGGKLILPSGLKYIGRCAFLNSLSCNEAVLGEGYNYVSPSCLGKLKIPESVEYIGGWAFGGNIGLCGKIVIPKNIKEINPGVFCRTAISGVEMHEGIEAVHSYAFLDCFMLKDIVWSNNIQHIGDYAFSTCSSIEGELTLPSSLQTIGSYAFSKCTGLTNIIIPASVVDIGSSAFSTVTSVTMLGSTPPKITASTFTTDVITSIKVPVGSASAYQSAENWSAFSSIITEVS